ncbi:MAG: TonB-dependent receptor, partial [Cytophagales bacterium]|nr:TonB-dependent receptor [Cytophagales bacterium]
MTRLTPQASNNSFNGVSWRYNNISVDGAVNNDAIGFSPSLGGVSGTANMPGSSTRTNSISLDAIDQLQVQIAPFDVKYGNFTGGSINAVTRRGTNELTGSVYAFGRNSWITGPNNSGDKSAMPSSYYDYQIGARVGLPIIKDKLFLFTNIETTNRQEPLFNGAGQNGGLIADSTAQHIAKVLQNQTGNVTIGTGTNSGIFNGWNGGDPGLGFGYQNFTIFSRSTKVFARLDWNINDRHQLTYRTNYIPSQASFLDRSALEYRFANNAFVQKNDQISNVLELKSRWTNKLSGQLILGYTSIHDYRDPTALGSPVTPQIQISGVNGGSIFIGTDRESAAFNQYSKTTEITYNLNYYWRKHNFTLGTHNELYGISYGFVNSYNGRIDYSSLQNFYSEKMSRFRAFYNVQDNSRDYVY